MAYDEEIERTIERIFPPDAGLTSKRMFGGVCYLYKGNMAFGIHQDRLIVRLGSPDRAQAHIDSGWALAFDITGKAMKGWVMIPKSKLTEPKGFQQWLEKGLAFAKSLPPK